ncbi:hypothetical protein ACRAWF_36655 [Streptomyces sp. L7]
MPYTSWTWKHGAPGIWGADRRLLTAPVGGSPGGDLRPIWESVYNHYVNRRGLDAPYVTALRRGRCAPRAVAKLRRGRWLRPARLRHPGLPLGGHSPAFCAGGTSAPVAGGMTFSDAGKQ